MFKISKKTVTINGRELIFETGKIARQAHGAVTIRCGDTILLATACRSDKASEDIDFFPLRVDYNEKFSSTGKTLGGFIKREGRPKEREILVCRIIDRPIRPLFPKGYYNEVQILNSVLSYDGVHTPEPMALCATSAALTISDIPLIKPIAGVRVGMIDDVFVVNPTLEEMESSRLDLILAGTKDAILMIEGYADFLTEACSNSLLKSVEEPPTGYHFIFLAERLSQILPTIQSRCMIKSLYEEDQSTFGQQENHNMFVIATRFLTFVRYEDKTMGKSKEIGRAHV